MVIDEEYWLMVCRKALVTNDPDEFAWIIRDINRMLYEKGVLLKEQRADQATSWSKRVKFYPHISGSRLQADS